ncbi:NAD(P)-binding protein [Meredithblackwellia eburnea MCA 4105]
MTSNTSLVYASLPKGAVVPGQDLKRFQGSIDVENVDLQGGVLVQNKALSLDPFMRGRMRDPSIKSYSPAYELGKPIAGFTVGSVVRSDHASYPVGSAIYGNGPFEEWTVISKATLEDKTKLYRSVDAGLGLPWTNWVGGAGMSGQTAWWGYQNIGKPKPGETIFVSAAAGAVGQIVIQLAKADGLKVIGSVGSDEKVEFIKELGCDVAFNYKTESTLKILQENPFDIFFDNVGGETLDQVFTTINTYGRIISCGSVSQYNLAPHEKYRLANYQQITIRQLHVEGFIISFKNLDEFYKVVPKMIKDGKLRIKEHVTKGIDEGEAFVDMLSGKAQGKAVISLE